MPREVVPFADGHLADATALLARRHAALRGREPRLPAKFEDRGEALRLIEALLPVSNGVVALEGGKTVGFLLSQPELHWGGRGQLVPLEGHAVDHPDAAEVYREMYTSASPGWDEGGYFVHTVNIGAGDDGATAAFFSLGFGQMLAFGLRDLAPADGGAPGKVRIERAGEAQIEEVQRLMLGLGRYNSQPPLYRPFVLQGDLEWARRPTVLQQMADEACAYWLAYDGDDAVGLMIFTPPDPTELMVTPEDAAYLWIAYLRPEARRGGIGKALLDQGLAWARSRGHRHCSVGWFTTNIAGARFWTRHGFTPVMYRLERRVDERIAWAKAGG